MDNPVDIIQDIMTTYTTLVFNSAFFNLTEWEIARAAVTWITSISVFEKNEIIDVISVLTNSIRALLDVQGDGKFTLILRNTAAASVATINLDQIIAQAALDNGSDEYMNSARVKYNNFWASDRGRFYTDDSRKQQLFTEHRRNVEQEFETVLTLESDAIAFAEQSLDDFGGIFATFDIVTTIQNINLQLGDNVDLQVSKGDDDLETGEYVKCEVLSKTIDLNHDSYSTTLKLRFIEDVTANVNVVEITRYKPLEV
jgi:hypothetical protein